MNFRIMLLCAFFLPAGAMAAEMLSVASEQVNVRGGPGNQHETEWAAARYYPLQVVDREGNWIRVSDYENEEGWIYGPLLSAVPSVVVISQKANIREGAGMDYETLWVLDKAYALKVLETDGAWLKVSDGEEVTGWIHKSVTWGFTGSSALEKTPAY